VTELQRLQRLEAEVLATAEQQPVSVLEWCQLGAELDHEQLLRDLAFLQAHPAFRAIAHAVLLDDGAGLHSTIVGPLGVVVRDVAAYLRARESRTAP
jgi:hypothetical protein